MKFKLNEALIKYNEYEDAELPLDAWDLYEELKYNYSDRQIIEILVNHDILPEDMIDKYDNDEVDIYDDVISVMDNMSEFELRSIPEFEDAIYNKIFPNIEDELGGGE